MTIDPKQKTIDRDEVEVRPLKLLRKNYFFFVVIAIIALTSLRLAGNAGPSGGRRTIEELYEKLDFPKENFQVLTARDPPRLQHKTNHVAFLKVHKSGSTTAQNMFLRFGWNNNLTFVLPPNKNAFGYPNIISLSESMTVNNTLPPPRGKRHEILCNHVLYNRTVFRKYLPNDTFYIGIIREPYETFKSILNYLRPGYVFKIKSDKPGSEYLKNPKLYEPKSSPRRSATNNRIAVEFGFPDDVIINRDKNRALDYIKQLDEDFGLVIVVEHFEESILLMKRLLGWSTKDILYIDKNISKKKDETTLVRPFDRELYKKWATIDYALYEHFFRKLRQQIRTEGYDFDDELLHFKEIRKMTTEFCRQKPSILNDSVLVVQKSAWSPGFTVDQSDCQLLKLGEIPFTQKIRERQYGTTDI